MLAALCSYTMEENKTYDQQDFSGQELFDGEYIKCTFNNCNFSRTNFRGTDFLDCTFNTCDMSLATMQHTGLKNVQFTSCKLMGINFSLCSNFMFFVFFSNCVLDYSSFFQKKMKKIHFIGCSLKQVDFEEADLAMSIFTDCDLTDANFSRTNLEKADFRKARNYAFDPEINKIKKAKFSYLGIAGLLAKHKIDIEFD